MYVFIYVCMYVHTHTYIYICMYIVSSHKLWYMLLGAEFVFLFRIRRGLGGASGLYL